MTKRESTYRFVRQSGGVGHYAQVTLAVEETPSTGLTVQILPTAFAWLKEVYGPDAWEWAICDEYRRSALFGVAYALQHAKIPFDIAHVTISVVTIHASPADTSGDDVAYATAFAVWQACEVEPSVRPRLEGRHIIFPQDDVVQGSRV